MPLSDTPPADRVIAFWFSERDANGIPVHRKAWFEKNTAFDSEIRALFLADVEAAADGCLDAMANTPLGAVALVILLDQFPRNLFRGTGRAFTADGKAREIADAAIARGFDRELPAVMRQFLYLPFEHAENLDDQDRCVALFERLGNPELVKWAVRHHEIIVRFGRFPHRNAALGRESTPEEIAFLREPNSSF